MSETRKFSKKSLLEIEEAKEEAKARAIKEGKEWTADDEVMWSPETFQAIRDRVDDREHFPQGDHENIGFVILFAIPIILIIILKSLGL